jgi:hypothetical protein
MPTKKSEEKVSIAALKSAALATPSNFVMDASMFDSTEGEEFAGLNVLALEVGQPAGPFVISRILRGVPVSKKVDPKKKKKPVDKYFAFLTDMNGVKIAGKSEVALPIAAAFTMKCNDAGVKEGDIIALKRTADYDSGQPAKGKGYILKVIKRATETHKEPLLAKSA